MSSNGWGRSFKSGGRLLGGPAYGMLGAMLSLKANVRNGRIVLDEPTELPDGAVVDLIAIGGQALEDIDDEERMALHAALLEGIMQDEAGDTVDADEVFARFPARAS